MHIKKSEGYFHKKLRISIVNESPSRDQSKHKSAGVFVIMYKRVFSFWDNSRLLDFEDDSRYI